MLTLASPKDVQPPLAKIALKPHQLAMLKRCKEIEAKRKGFGVMKDPPGSGKTYVILSLILQDIAMKDKSTNIVVVPQNIYTQWETAITNFSNNIQYAKYIEYSQVYSLYFNPSFHGIHIVLTTPVYFNVINDALETAKTRVNRIIIDEIDSITFLHKSKSTMERCRKLWLVSASIDRIEHSLEQSYHYHANGNVNTADVTCQCSADFVATGFPLPPYIQKDILCVANYLDNILYGVLSPSEMQAANAFDYSKIEQKHITMIATNEKEALEFLMKDLISDIECEKEQIAHYDELLEREKNETNAVKVTLARDKSNENLKKSTNRLKSIYDRLKESNMCLICYDEFNNTPKVITICCQNSFCQTCISHWYNVNNCINSFRLMEQKKCPYCRAVTSYDSHVLVSPNTDNGTCNGTCTFTEPNEPLDQTTLSNKMDTLKKLLLYEVGSKVIIFSEYNNMFKEISKMLDALNITFIEIDGGNIGAIDKDIHNYKFGDVRVIMCNSKSFGCGLNLEKTTDIIFFHKTDPGMFTQVIGRAQRPGRTSPLNVFRLLHNNEN